MLQCTPSGIPIDNYDDKHPDTDGQDALIPDRTIFSEPIVPIDSALVTAGQNTIDIIFRNNLGVPITLPLTGTITPKEGTVCKNPMLNAKVNDEKVVAGQTIINSGDEFTIRWDCDDYAVAARTPFDATLTFDYTNTETMLTKTSRGTVVSKYMASPDTDGPGSLLPEKTTFSAPIPSIGGAAIHEGTNKIKVPFVNNLGSAITLPSTGSVVPQEGSVCNNPVVTVYNMAGAVITASTRIENGEEFYIVWDCDDSRPKVDARFDAMLTFNYVNENGLSRTHSGSVAGIKYMLPDGEYFT